MLIAACVSPVAKLLGKDIHLHGVHCGRDLEEKQRGLEKRLEE